MPENTENTTTTGTATGSGSTGTSSRTGARKTATKPVSKPAAKKTTAAKKTVAASTATKPARKWDKKQILEKVRKLLSNAEDARLDPKVAEEFRRKALEMMANYNIDQAVAEAQDPEKQRVIDKTFLIEGPYREPKARLLTILAYGFRCDCLIDKHRDIAFGKVHVFGHPDDIEAIDLLYTQLRLQSVAAMLDHTKDVSRRQKATRFGFLQGFAIGVWQQLRDANEKATAAADKKAGGPSTELVLLGRQEAASNALRAMYPHTKPIKWGKGTTGVGAGYEAGLKADLGGGTAITDESTRRQLAS